MQDVRLNDMARREALVLQETAAEGSDNLLTKGRLPTRLGSQEEHASWRAFPAAIAISHHKLRFPQTHTLVMCACTEIFDTSTVSNVPPRLPSPFVLCFPFHLANLSLSRARAANWRLRVCLHEVSSSTISPARRKKNHSRLRLVLTSQIPPPCARINSPPRIHNPTAAAGRFPLCVSCDLVPRGPPD